jgi:antitoxin component YwqK of YwqJK toxin-antitoxin module
VKKNILKHKSIDYQFILLMCCLAFMALSVTGGYAQSIPDGKYIMRYDDGVVKERGFYHNSQKHKVWLHYNPNGTIDLKEKWDNGVLKWQIFYSKGRIIKTIDENGVLKTRKGCGC